MIRPGNDRLDDVTTPLKARDDQHVEMDYEVSDYDSPATMRVTTTFRGRAADSMRRSLVDTEYSSLSESYLNYYAETYPGIRDPQPLEVEDDTNRNVVRIKEAYTIDNLFATAEGEASYAELYPFGLVDALPIPETRIRKSPLALPYPMRRTFHITLTTPDALGYEDYSEELNHTAFKFSTQSKFRGNKSTFDYSLETLRDRISAENTAVFLQKADQLHELVGDYPERPLPLMKTINWWVVAFTIVFSMAIAGVAYWICQSLRFRGDGVPVAGFESIGGWLVLVGIGIVFGPFISIAPIFQDADVYFSKDAYAQVPTAFVLFFELLLQAFMAVATAALAYAFFRKRKVFPPLYVFLTMLFIVMGYLDIFLCSEYLDLPATAEDHASMSQAVFRAMIWVPYMFRSRRVRGTFVY